MRHVSLCLLSGVIALILVGCGEASSGSGLSKEQERVADNVGKWAKESDGKWENLTPDQKQAMIKSAGTEEAAKKIIEFSAHPPAPVAGGPPAGWKPGGSPPNMGK